MVTDDDERDWVEPALLTLLGVEQRHALHRPTSCSARGARSSSASPSTGTVALVFEDLHHADTGLLDFIDHMLDWSRGHPDLHHHAARPELLDRRADWGAGKRNFTSIYLEPLPEAQMRELLAGLVPGLPKRPPSTPSSSRADGIPLYAVETVRMLVADGRLEGGERGVRAARAT